MRFILFFPILFFSLNSFAQESLKNYPGVNGQILLMGQADYLATTDANNLSKENTIFYSQADFALNFNKNWAIKTQWRSFPQSQIYSNQEFNFKRYYSFNNENRGINLDDHAVVIEELKLDFENEDLHFYLGKFDPEFGTAHRKSKRIGVFTWQFNEDYNLREKIGGGISALLENSIISFNTFFNDTTDLSKSAIKDRGTASNQDGIAGSNGTLSSYSVSINGKDFFGVDNLFYNFGYRNLGINSALDRHGESGYVAGFEYLYHLSGRTNIVPLIEIVKINDFGGASGRDAMYYTLSTVANYSSWSASVTYNKKDIKATKGMNDKIADTMLQMTIGYKIYQNMTLDFTRATINEDGDKSSLFGLNLSYLYRF